MASDNYDKNLKFGRENFLDQEISFKHVFGGGSGEI